MSSADTLIQAVPKTVSLLRMIHPNSIWSVVAWTGYKGDCHVTGMQTDPIAVKVLFERQADTSWLGRSRPWLQTGA